MLMTTCVRTPITIPILLGELTLRRVTFPGLRITSGIFGEASSRSFPLEALMALENDIAVAHLASWPLASNSHPPKIKGLHCYTPRQYRRFFIDMSMPFSSYLDKFSSKSRSTVQRKLRKFAQASGGKLEFVEFSQESDILHFHQLARRVSRVTYQETLLHSGMPDGEAFRQTLVDMSRQDRVRGYILFYNSQPTAYMYCPIIDGIVQYEHVGFDPQQGALSPGTVLFFLAIQRLFEERKFIAFDFTEGEGEHKSFFSNCHVDCADIYYLRHSACAHATVLSHALCQSTSRIAGVCLGRLGLKRAVTHFLRRKSTDRQSVKADT
jgi:hypothetical protein